MEVILKKYKKIKLIEGKKAKLYDGDELGIRNSKFSIEVNSSSFKINIFDFYNNPLRNIINIISENDLRIIVSSQGFIETKKLFIDYKSTNNLDIYYCKQDNFIFLFSMGEFQPTRYMIFLEAIWTLDE